jgi:uncharacterized membrane protein
MENESVLKKIFNVTLQGLFWVIPIAAVIMVAVWLYDKTSRLAQLLFGIIGFTPQSNYTLWMLLVLAILGVVLYVVGYFMETRLASVVESIFCKVPGYSTIKDIVNIFNSSKKGDTKVLVVAISGFAKEGYNIGLMYSQKESIIKDHYTVTLSQTPLPNGGYMFEVHRDNIHVIEEATFDNNLQYLLSMGVKSLADIIKTEPKDLKSLITLDEWLQKSR